jgi:hypothetical protein
MVQIIGRLLQQRRRMRQIIGRMPAESFRLFVPGGRLIVGISVAMKKIVDEGGGSNAAVIVF